MVGVEVTAKGTDLSPHQQLVEAFSVLKKEKEALDALTELQKQEKGAMKAELDATRKELDEKTAKIVEMEAMIELKAASAECQIAEAASNSKAALAEANEKNDMYSKTIKDLKFLLDEARKDKEVYLERTAVLARRDQLQKANIMTLTEEINHLTGKITEFENRSASLASRCAEMSKSHLQELEKRQSTMDSEQFDKWMDEKKGMVERINFLESSCERMKSTETIMKDSFVESLTKHREAWKKEKDMLKKQIKELVSEKESIESQVAEIAELLEREHIERTGEAFNDDDDSSRVRPAGTKKSLVYNQ